LELNLKVVGREIEVYNAISPNGDGLNDVLVIRNIGMYPSNELLIFNRRGQVVYDTRGYGQGNTFFDGRDKQGGLLPSGQYFYALTITTASGEQQLKGTVFISY
jgi:gliding motility-associated-like protein